MLLPANNSAMVRRRGRRGLGDAPDAPDAVVSACSPDICFNLGFPWVGRRTELAAGATQPFGSFEATGSGCRCATVLDLPTAVGLGVTGVLGLLLVVKLVQGRGY
jgi:hypothetical protein